MQKSLAPTSQEAGTWPKLPRPPAFHTALVSCVRMPAPPPPQLPPGVETTRSGKSVVVSGALEEPTASTELVDEQPAAATDTAANAAQTLTQRLTTMVRLMITSATVPGPSVWRRR